MTTHEDSGSVDVFILSYLSNVEEVEINFTTYSLNATKGNLDAVLKLVHNSTIIQPHIVLQ